MEGGKTIPGLTVTATRVLQRSRDMVKPSLAAAVGRLPPDMRSMAGYSFGWHAVDGAPQIGGGGKGMRQALAVLAAEAVGGPGEAAVPGAVAVELLHAFSLVHDDIMDGDEQRRGRPTVWKAFGTGPAVLVGDALLSLAMEVAVHGCGEYSATAVRVLCDTLAELLRGQAEDLRFEQRPWRGPETVSVKEYRLMARHKTGALLGCAGELGCLLAGGHSEHRSAFAAAGRRLGLASSSAEFYARFALNADLECLVHTACWVYWGFAFDDARCDEGGR